MMFELCIRKNTLPPMKPTPLKPRKVLNKAFLKVKPNRSEIERFKANLIQLLDRSNDTKSEAFNPTFYGLITMTYPLD